MNYLRTNLFCLVPIILLAFFLRVYGIGWGLPTKEHYHQSFHPDEAYKLKVITNMHVSEPNPHYFLKGNMQFYVIGAALKLAGYLKIVELKSPEFYMKNPDELARLYLVGRLITVGMSLMTICIVFMIGSKLYGNPVGLLAAVFLSVLPSDVVNAHYMKTDVPQTFWLCLTVLFSIQVWKTRKPFWYALAGLTAGFATATKYTAGLSILTIIMAHLLQKDRWVKPKEIFPWLISRKLFLAVFFMFAGFFIGAPYVFLSFGEFRHDVAIPMSMVKHQEILFADYDLDLDVYGRGPIWLYYLTHVMYYGMGMPLQIVSIVGCILALFKRKTEDLLLLSWIVPYFLLMGFAKAGLVRYLTPLGPFFMIFGANVLLSLPKPSAAILLRVKKIALPVLIGCILSYSLLYSLAYDHLMAQKDVRIETLEWIQKNIPKGSIIAVPFLVHWYSPPISKEDYKIETTGLDPEMIRAKEFNFFVISNYEYRQFFRQRNIFPRETKAMDILMNGGEFKQVCYFEKRPELFGFSLPAHFPPHDWMYPFPAIRIIQKVPM